MGLLVDGKWQDKWYDTDKHGGKFKREDAGFRDWIRADGSSRYSPEAGRYHLYISLACPWAHRTLIFLALKGLQDVITVDVVDWYMGEHGWTFRQRDGATGDSLHGKDYLHEIYTMAKPDYTGRVTTPTLWDRETETIVSNESADIIRMFNSEFEEFAKNDIDLYPEALRDDIDAVNEDVYHNINNGVYKTGFATTQEAYEEAFDALFAALDRIEKRLDGRDWLVGDQQTEADWRLFTTLVRFDPVYHGHFKCNRQMLREFPQLRGYLARLYRYPGIAETTDFTHIRNHYYQSHGNINPTKVVPKGPEPLVPEA
ncbi:MAG: glutathione S-transferase family protein [Gammaproteobacteria bacterium]|nr:glutathione S-transferase family protein [Gammaproteobacteria bacterium]